MKNTQKTVKCDACGKEFKRRAAAVREMNYCSRECADKGNTIRAYNNLSKKVGQDFKEWLSNEYTNKMLSTRQIALGLYGTSKNSSSILTWLTNMGIERRTGGEAVKTQWINNDERRSEAAESMKKRLTPEVRKKITASLRTPESKEKQRISKMGKKNGMYNVLREEHPQWNSERTDKQRVAERKTVNDSRWRKSVFSRDKKTCRRCGYKGDGIMVAHHIESYMNNKEGRYDIDNGITLCKDCHDLYHSNYGWRDSTKEKFEQFKQQ